MSESSAKETLIGCSPSPSPESMSPDQKKLKSLMRQLSDQQPIMDGRPLAARYFRIFTVVSLYWVVSITLVFVNKSLLSGGESIDAPLFVTFYQCVVTVACCYGIAMLPKSYETSLSLDKMRLSTTMLVKVLPLSVILVAMISFNNLCLKHVGVSFYYIGRSLTTVFNVIMTFLILHQKTSPKAVLCCVLIIAGFWLGIDQENEVGSFSLHGTIFGVLASLFVSLYAIYIKRILPVVDNNVWLLTFYNNINAIALFLPLMLLTGEFPVIFNFSGLFSLSFWSVMTVGGVFGCAIGYVTGLQVKVTSPLTHNISGTAKAAAQTVLATQFNDEVKTFWWWMSNFIVLVGSALYTRVRQLEMASENQRSAAQSEAKKPTNI